MIIKITDIMENMLIYGFGKLYRVTEINDNVTIQMYNENETLTKSSQYIIENFGILTTFDEIESTIEEDEENEDC